MVLIGLPKVKFVVWASGDSDKNREGVEQMIEAREEGGYMAPSSAPQIKAPRSAPRSAAPSLLPCQTPHQTPSLCGRGTSAPYSVAPRRVSSAPWTTAPTYGVHFHKTL